MKKLVPFFILSLIGTTVFAWTPDSVYINSGALVFLHYAETAVRVKEITFDERNKITVENRIATNRDSNKYLTTSLYGYDEFRLNVDCERDLLGKKIPLSYKHGYHDYAFFAPDRYTTVRWEKGRNREGEERAYRENHFTVANAWKQESESELNFVVLYDLHSYFQEKAYYKREERTFDPDEYDYDIDGFVLPMKDGRYLLVADYESDTICAAQQYSYDPIEMLYSRQLQKDTDTLQINGKYGLYTITGKEVIPALYDSLKTDEVLVRGFRNGRIDLINYMGKTIRENLRVVYPVVYRYQILEDDGRMYFMDNLGNEKDTYSYGYMSVDDQLYPLGLDIILLPPKKIIYQKKKYEQYTWVNFIYPYDYMKFERMKKLRSPFGNINEKEWKMLGFTEPYDSWTSIRCHSDFEESVVKRYGLDRYEWHESSYWNQRNDMYGYEVEAYDLPKEYKDPVLISGKDEYYRSGDYVSLPASWIIAKKKGKYGVFDVREKNKEVLPFVYDAIEANYRYLILKKKDLIAYYPLSATPRYTMLEPFKHMFARFQLPDGRYGWLGKDNKEYIDNE